MSGTFCVENVVSWFDFCLFIFSMVTENLEFLGKVALFVERKCTTLKLLL